MGTRGSPDMYTLSPWAYGPHTSGVYIRQTTYAHGITIKYRKQGKIRWDKLLRFSWFSGVPRKFFREYVPRFNYTK